VEYPTCDEEIPRIRKRLIDWGRNNYKSFPWRDPARDWHGLIAEIFLQRTKAENVVPVFKTFCQRYPAIEDFADADEEELTDLIQPLGLRKRVSQLKALGNDLGDIGYIPDDRKTLEGLPGVGPYTAAAWLSLHRSKVAAIVDSNVVRWLCRMIGRDYDRKLRRKKWLVDLAEEITPNEKTRQFNYALLDFTREICTPRSPTCSTCPLGPKLCEYGARVLESRA